MAAVDAITAGTAHGTLTANTPEVISLGVANQIEVQNRGTTIMYVKLNVADLTLAAQGTEAVVPGESVTFYGDSASATTVCLKSSGTPDYSVSRFLHPSAGGGSSSGGAGGEVELGATSLAALESITIGDGSGPVTVDGTVEIGATSLAALESVTVVDGGGTLSIDDAGGSLTVDGTVASTQSGTWTVQPGNTANSTAWKVDGSAVTQPVSGTVTADTELPAAAALSDTASNPTTPTVGGANLYWNGTQWARWQRNVKTLTVSAATLANVAASASSVTIFASNAAARGRMVHNDSASATLYLKYGATASATSYTVAIAPGQHYEFPAPLYTGACDGIWTAAVGNARTTETS